MIEFTDRISTADLETFHGMEPKHLRLAAFTSLVVDAILLDRHQAYASYFCARPLYQWETGANGDTLTYTREYWARAQTTKDYLTAEVIVRFRRVDSNDEFEEWEIEEVEIATYPFKKLRDFRQVLPLDGESFFALAKHPCARSTVVPAAESEIKLANTPSTLPPGFRRSVAVGS